MTDAERIAAISSPTADALYLAGRVAYGQIAALPRWLQAAISAIEVEELSLNATVVEHFCGHTRTARGE